MLAYRFHNNSPKKSLFTEQDVSQLQLWLQNTDVRTPVNLFEICSKITQQRLMRLHLQGKSASRRTHLLGCKPQITKSEFSSRFLTVFVPEVSIYLHSQCSAVTMPQPFSHRRNINACLNAGRGEEMS
mgnify:CR=1 FL=1